MTRVQELGRLCRYPGTSDTLILRNSDLSSTDVRAKLQEAFTFACKADIQLDLEKCQQIALPLCEAAKDIFAYVSWMGMSRQRQSSQQHLDKLRQLVEALALQVWIIQADAQTFVTGPHNSNACKSTILAGRSDACACFIFSILFQIHSIFHCLIMLKLFYKGLSEGDNCC